MGPPDIQSSTAEGITRRIKRKTTNMSKSGTSKNSPHRNEPKKSKSSDKVGKSVRKKVTPYLDVPVLNKNSSTKVRLLKSSKKRTARAAGNPNKQEKSAKTTPSNQVKETRHDSASIPMTLLNNVRSDANYREGSKSSPSAVIQSILQDSFETRVKSILPTLWQSPKLLGELSVHKSNELNITDSILDNPVSKQCQTVIFSLTPLSSHAGMITDSRTSTPSHSPSKNTKPSENGSAHLLLEIQVENSGDIEAASQPMSSSRKYIFDQSLPSKNKNEDIKKINKGPITGISSPKRQRSVDSSPIKVGEHEFYLSLNQLSQSKTVIDADFPDTLDSVNLKKKSVGFSDEIECFSSPPPSSPLKIVGPLKSILKTTGIELESLNSTDDTNDFTNFTFWVNGSIVQLPIGSNDNVLLLDRATKDLLDPKFSNKFEAYTSINNIIKVNSIDNSVSWLTPKCSSLLEFAYRDISEGADYGNPFCTRTMIQGIKLATFFFSNERIQEKLLIPATRKFIMFCCNLIQCSAISKGMTSLLLQLFRDQRLPSKVVTPKTGEFILQAILNMKTFPSISLTIECLNTLCEYIKNNFMMLQKNLNSWLGFLFVHLTDTTSSLGTRVVMAASKLLSEVCKKFMHSRDFKFSLFYFIHQPLSFMKGALESQPQLEVNPDSLEKDIKILNYLCDNLKVLASRKNTRLVMDIWFHMTLLLSRSNPNEGVESWDGLMTWINVWDDCFANCIIESKISTIKAWRAIIYSCLQTLNLKGDFVAENKRLALVSHPFIGVKIQEGTNPKAISCMHSLFITTLCTYQNITSVSSKSNHLMLDEMWNSLIEPVLKKFYFRREESTISTRSISGVELLNALLSNNYGVKNLDIEISLRPNLASIQELSSLSPRWVYQNYRKLQEFIVISFRMQGLDDSKKLELLNSYINCLRISTSRAFKQTGNKKLDICSDIPSLMFEFFENMNLTTSVDFVFDLLIRMNDAFGLGALIDDFDIKNPCFIIISKLLTIKNFSSKKLIELCKFISNILGYKLQLVFYQDLLHFENRELRSFVVQKVQERKFSKMSSIEYEYLGMIIQTCNPGELGNDFISSLVRHIINPIAEKNPMKAIELLKIGSWNVEQSSWAIFQMMDHKSKLGAPRNSSTTSIMKFTMSIIIMQNLDAGCTILEKLCVPPRKEEILGLSQLIIKGMHSIFSRSVENRERIHTLGTYIMNLFENDNQVLQLFSGLPKHISMNGSVLSVDNHGLSAELACDSTDTVVISSSGGSLDQSKERCSSLELIMENDDSVEFPADRGSNVHSSSSAEDVDLMMSQSQIDLRVKLHSDLSQKSQSKEKITLDEVNENSEINQEIISHKDELSTIPDTQIIGKLVDESDGQPIKDRRGGPEETSILECTSTEKNSITTEGNLSTEKSTRLSDGVGMNKSCSMKRTFDDCLQGLVSQKKRKTEDQTKSGEDEDEKFDISSLSSLSDVEESLDNAEIEKEFDLNFSFQMPNPNQILDGSIENSSSGGCDKIAWMKTKNQGHPHLDLNGAEINKKNLKRHELQTSELTIENQKPIRDKDNNNSNNSNNNNNNNNNVVVVDSFNIEDGTRLTNDKLIGMIHLLASKIDTNGLGDNAKRNLENELLKLIMKLRNI